MLNQSSCSQSCAERRLLQNAEKMKQTRRLPWSTLRLMNNGIATATSHRPTVVFMRHGVAQHNVLDKYGQRPSLVDPSLWDPPLIEAGKKQAVTAGDAVAKYLNHKIDLIVASPLTRCLQTALLAFPPGEHYEHPVPPKFVCKESTREAFGMHYPDKRRNKSLLQRYWHAVEFESEMTESDTWWRPDQRETMHELQERTQAFLRWLSDRAEKVVVVVSHGVWIECLLRSHLNGRRVYNTDAFVCTLSSDASSMILTNVHQIYGIQQGNP